MKPLTVDEIKTMSYPDFIGILGLENISLAGDFTVDYWISKSNLNKESKVLEIACSTGFNLRHCILKTKARGIGIDISKTAIDCAQEITEKSGIDDRIQFKVGNAECLKVDSKSFTHVISGMSFAFIEKKDKALKEVARLLLPGGYLLTATPYYKKKPSTELLHQIEKVFGFRPADTWNYDWWNSFFSQFFILTHEISIIRSIPMVNEKVLKNQILEYIITGDHRLKNSTLEIKNICAERLLEIHLTINENARYQVGSLQVWQLKQ